MKKNDETFYDLRYAALFSSWDNYHIVYDSSAATRIGICQIASVLSEDQMAILCTENYWQTCLPKSLKTQQLIENEISVHFLRHTVPVVVPSNITNAYYRDSTLYNYWRQITLNSVTLTKLFWNMSLSTTSSITLIVNFHFDITSACKILRQLLAEKQHSVVYDERLQTGLKVTDKMQARTKIAATCTKLLIKW